MSDPPNAYRDELAAAQARIATLEAGIRAARDDDPVARWVAELRAERDQVGAAGARFLGLGADGLGAVLVAALLIGTSATLGVLFGAFVPAIVAMAVGGLFVTMLALALRSTRRNRVGRELGRVEGRIAHATPARRRVASEPAGALVPFEEAFVPADDPADEANRACVEDVPATKREDTLYCE